MQTRPKTYYWDQFVRLLAGLFVVFLFYLSVTYMADGFGINDPNRQWVGLALGVGGFVLQIIFNRGTKNPTLFIIGLATYIYGFSMTYKGLSLLMKDSLVVASLTFVIEVGPESIFMWVLEPEAGSPFDFVTAFFSGLVDGIEAIVRLVHRLQGGQRHPNTPYSGTNSKRKVEPIKRPESLSKKVNRTEPNKKSPNKTARKVIRFMLEHKKQNGQYPTTDFTAQETGIAKSTVYPTWKAVKRGEYS